MLFEGDTPVRILLPDDLEELVEKGEIDFPRITEKEIQDRSKGDQRARGGTNDLVFTAVPCARSRTSANHRIGSRRASICHTELCDICDLVE